MKKLKLNICKYSGDKQVEKIGNVKNIAIILNDNDKNAGNNCYNICK